MTQIGDFEIFLDGSHYQMWAIRKIGSEQVIHFITRSEAEFAAKVITEWSRK